MFVGSALLYQIQKDETIFWSVNEEEILLYLKFRYFEKATKFETIFQLFLRLLSKSADLSKQVEDCFKFLEPFQKSSILKVS